MKEHFVPYHVFIELVDGLEVYPVGITVDLTNKGFDFNKPIMKYEDLRRQGLVYLQKE
ncbi:hypothetical protein ABWK22_02375 [Gottfriedia acidiceleris]|uniref:hypothetical protein n=1 Tax=Gottfriedia acidiceleris TaxID=371036 RepID=UPI00339B4B95